MMIPFTADKSFPLLEYIDQAQEVRTGVSRKNQGISADDLNRTATGVNLLQQAAAQRVELFARIFASGVEDLMRGILRSAAPAAERAPTTGGARRSTCQWEDEARVGFVGSHRQS